MPYHRKKRYTRKTTKVVPRVFKRYVNKTVHRNIEDKMAISNMNTNFPSCGITWSEKDMTDITQGIDKNYRIGDEIRLRNWCLNGVVYGGQSGTAADDAEDTLRIVLALWDSRTQTPLASCSATMQTQINRETCPGLIKKYLDVYVPLVSNGPASSGYVPVVKTIKKFVRLSNVKIKYLSNNGATAQQKLIFSVLSDSGGIPNPGFVYGNQVLYYEDN